MPKLSQKAKGGQNLIRKEKMPKLSQKAKGGQNLIRKEKIAKTLLKSEGSAKLSQKGKGVADLRISKTKEMPMVYAIELQITEMNDDTDKRSRNVTAPCRRENDQDWIASLTAEWKRALRQQFRNLVLIEFLTAMAMQRKEAEEEAAENEDDTKEDYDDEFENDEACDSAR
jgi:hypothetical protein